MFCLEEGCPPKSEAPNVSGVVLDGAAIIQLLKPTGSRRFAEYAHQEFIPYIPLCHQKSTRVDLVWDRYFTSSIKGTAREKCGKEIRRCVCPDAALQRTGRAF